MFRCFQSVGGVWGLSSLMDAVNNQGETKNPAPPVKLAGFVIVNEAMHRLLFFGVLRFLTK